MIIYTRSLRLGVAIFSEPIISAIGLVLEFIVPDCIARAAHAALAVDVNVYRLDNPLVIAGERLVDWRAIMTVHGRRRRAVRQQQRYDILVAVETSPMLMQMTISNYGRKRKERSARKDSSASDSVPRWDGSCKQKDALVHRSAYQWRILLRVAHSSIRSREQKLLHDVRMSVCRCHVQRCSHNMCHEKLTEEHGPSQYTVSTAREL